MTYQAQALVFKHAARSVRCAQANTARCEHAAEVFENWTSDHVQWYGTRVELEHASKRADEAWVDAVLWLAALAAID